MLYEDRILTLSTADENVIVREMYPKRKRPEHTCWQQSTTSLSNEIESSVLAQLLNDFHPPFKDEEALLNYKFYQHQPMKYSI